MQSTTFERANFSFSLFHPAEGIESVEIVQVSNVVSMTTELEQNAVDITISCQGRWVVKIRWIVCV